MLLVRVHLWNLVGRAEPLSRCREAEPATLMSCNVFRHCDFVANCVLCFKWGCEKLKLGIFWYDNSNVFQNAFEKAMMTLIFMNLKILDLGTSEMDFEINGHVRLRW